MGEGHGTWSHETVRMAVACVPESHHLSGETDPALWRCVKIKQISTRETLTAALGTGGGLGKCWFYFSSLERGKAMDGPTVEQLLGWSGG